MAHDLKTDCADLVSWSIVNSTWSRSLLCSGD
jgi:hypothetical protein